VYILKPLQAGKKSEKYPSRWGQKVRRQRIMKTLNSLDKDSERKHEEPITQKKLRILSLRPSQLVPERKIKGDHIYLYPLKGKSPKVGNLRTVKKKRKKMFGGRSEI